MNSSHYAIHTAIALEKPVFYLWAHMLVHLIASSQNFPLKESTWSSMGFLASSRESQAKPIQATPREGGSMCSRTLTAWYWEPETILTLTHCMTWIKSCLSFPICKLGIVPVLCDALFIHTHQVLLEAQMEAIRERQSVFKWYPPTQETPSKSRLML